MFNKVQLFSYHIEIIGSYRDKDDITKISKIYIFWNRCKVQPFPYHIEIIESYRDKDDITTKMSKIYNLLEIGSKSVQSPTDSLSRIYK